MNQYFCERLIDGSLVQTNIFLQQKEILLSGRESNQIETIKFEDINEIRIGPKTDAWIAWIAESGTIEPENTNQYFSIIHKSANKIWPGETDDFRILTNQNDIKHLETLLDNYKNQTESNENGLIKENEVLKMLFKRHAIYSPQSMDYMNLQGLINFYKFDQKFAESDYDCEPECKVLLHKYGKMSKGVLTLNEFCQMFENEPQFGLFKVEHKEICQDMTQPMSHYYISSSHNTYLMGKQIKIDKNTKSSYEMYRNILLDGCRCIEIDVWENKSCKAEPVVCHGLLGFSMTSKILLRGVLETINEYAFKASKFPLVLSIENHLGVESQNVMANMMRSIFGTKLYTKKVNKKAGQFPQLDEMKECIFIKGSKGKPKELEERESSRENIRHGNDSDDIHDDGDLNSNVDDVLQIEGDFDNFDSDDDYSDEDDSDDDGYDYIDYSDEDDDSDTDEEEEEDDGMDYDGSPTKESTIHEGPKQETSDFRNLINYFETKKFISIENCIDSFPFHHMFSLKNNKSLNILKQQPRPKQRQKAGIVYYNRFTRKNMVRIYPRGARQDSSNFKPVRHWSGGAQMVALNYQTVSSDGMLINWAQFALNGSCGYVLKPQYLRVDNGALPIQINLTVTILAGRYFPAVANNKLSVITRVYTPDLNKEMRKNQWKLPQPTKVIENVNNDINFNPIWDEKVTYVLNNPELSFIRFSLLDNNKVLIGNHMIAFQAMQKGYRSIDLYDNTMKQIQYAKIYLHVDWTEIQ